MTYHGKLAYVDEAMYVLSPSTGWNYLAAERISR